LNTGENGVTPVHYLWLMPEARVSRRLGDVIRALTARAGLPSFEPHVTLLGSVTGAASRLVEDTRRLAQMMAPLPIAISGVEHSAQYFRCVFLSAVLDPALASARARAERALESQGTPEHFSPHLSLLYGDLSPGIRRQLCDSIAGTYPARFTVDRLQLVAGAPDYGDWQMIAAFDLIGQTD
jgi:2'-5' RNA ligase